MSVFACCKVITSTWCIQTVHTPLGACIQGIYPAFWHIHHMLHSVHRGKKQRRLVHPYRRCTASHLGSWVGAVGMLYFVLLLEARVCSLPSVCEGVRCVEWGGVLVIHVYTQQWIFLVEFSQHTSLTAIVKTMWWIIVDNYYYAFILQHRLQLCTHWNNNKIQPPNIHLPLRDLSFSMNLGHCWSHLTSMTPLLCRMPQLAVVKVCRSWWTLIHSVAALPRVIVAWPG